MGRQLAKVALELQKSQDEHDEGANSQIKDDHQLQAQTRDGIASLEPSPSKTTKVQNTSEDKFTGVSPHKDGSTKLVTAKEIIHEGAKADIKSNTQEINKATSKALDPAKLLKTIKSEADLEDRRRQEQTTSKKTSSEDKIKANKSLSSSQRMLLDLQNGNKVKVGCLTLLNSEVKFNMMSYDTWFLLEKPKLKSTPSAGNHFQGYIWR